MRRLTSALDHLRSLARPHRYRVTKDREGFPIIPARYGHIEWFTEHALAVYSDRPRLFAKLWAIPGVRRHQTGDHEMRALFPPEAVEQVAGVIRAKRWGGSGRGRPGIWSQTPDKWALPRARIAFTCLGKVSVMYRQRRGAQRGRVAVLR
jgi:hypothetical protein